MQQEGVEAIPARRITRARQITVVLPAYNEALCLPRLLSRLDDVYCEYGLNMSVLVVNDGSQDDTAPCVNEFQGDLPIKLIDLKQNQGLANATRVGLIDALESSDDNGIIVVMDADNTHAPELILRMIRHITEGADVVIASRYQHGSRIRGLSAYRVLLSLGASWLFRMTVRMEGVRDYTCGFRAYRVDLLRKAFAYYDQDMIKQSGFGVMVEILLKLKPMEPIVHEVPIILRYDFKKGDSKMNVMKTVRETLTLLARYMFGKTY